MTAEKKFYLKEEVYVDPLVNKWYAWPNLIPPVTYAMYMTNTHKRLMKSFVNNYEMHIMASQDPAMVGSPEFVNCSEEQVDEVRKLIDVFETEHFLYGEIAIAIKELNDLLRQHKDGTSIEPLYEKVPERLKGYVELSMDLNHQPQYRLIEKLLYNEYYQPLIQSVSLGLLSRVEKRPFVLSTPRLADGNTLHLKLPFKSPKLDKLFAARVLPVTEQEIEDIFEGVEMQGGLHYRELFTTEQPYSSYQPVTEGIRFNYTGHAGILVETSECSILIDPVIASRKYEYAGDMFSHSDLPPKLDYVCLTHNHSDHINIETLLQIRHMVGTVLVPKNNGGSLFDPSLKLILEHLGFRVIEMDDLEEIPLKEGRILTLPFLGEHGDLNIRSKTAWFIELQGKKIYAGADSSNLEPKMYEHIYKMVGDMDILAIGMECVGAPYTWLYGALITEKVTTSIKESRRLNGSGCDAAARMVDTFNPKQVMVYALGLEPWYGYFMGINYTDDSKQIIESGKFKDYCESKGIPTLRLKGKHTEIL